MSLLWPRFTKENPCPACKHWDWTCRSGEKMFICMRVQSPMPHKSGGWYHRYECDNYRSLPPRRHIPRRCIDAERLLPKIASQDVSLESLAESLGVEVSALCSLQVVWSNVYGAWAVPMKDGNGTIVGIHLRKSSGEKLAVKGSRNGLFLPEASPQRIAFIPEGMSNTAALISMGFYAVGRPSCNTGAEMLRSAFNRLGIHQVVVVADNDALKLNGSRPGIEGAKQIQKQLGMKSTILVPPSPLKDIRQMVNKVGLATARAIIESDLKSKTWRTT